MWILRDHLFSAESAGGWTQHQADVPDVNADVIGAGASVYKDLAHATSYRLAYGGRVPSNALYFSI